MSARPKADRCRDCQLMPLLASMRSTYYSPTEKQIVAAVSLGGRTKAVAIAHATKIKNGPRLRIILRNLVERNILVASKCGYRLADHVLVSAR